MLEIEILDTYTARGARRRVRARNPEGRAAGFWAPDYNVHLVRVIGGTPDPSGRPYLGLDDVGETVCYAKTERKARELIELHCRLVEEKVADEAAAAERRRTEALYRDSGHAGW